MADIRFERIESEVRFLNPLQDFAEDSQMLELRRDPLLGDVSIYNPYLKDKAKTFFGDSDPELIRKLVEESAKNCFFCGDKLEKSTPRFRPDIAPNGRMREGEAVLFPNLFSLGTYHPVVSMSEAHFLKLSEFSPGLILNGLMVLQKFLTSVYRQDRSALFSAVTANYLFPAGASLVHPHLQALITPVPYSYHARLLNASSEYYRKQSSSFFNDLVTEEKTGQRYIAQRGKWHWLTPYSPMGNNEVIAIHEETADYGLLTGADLSDLSRGISGVLAFYESLGHLSFNYAVYSARQDSGAEGFRCLLKMVSRQNLYPNYRNDDYFLQKLLQSELIINLPEELAGRLKVYL